ncbi:MAG: hypothetical protein PHX43_06130 [Alphaproteobacteria bacterium]|nr:hypothetical protein [Alphaproteobacteria bacterium]
MKNLSLTSAFTILVAAALLSGLSACGKKPSLLDPPDGVSGTELYRVYPDLSTDPKPSEETK